jgi:ribosomal protein L13E
VGTDSEKERKFVRIQRKQLKVGTEIETGLQIVRPVMQHADFTKAFFTVRMSYGFMVHEQISLNLSPQAKCGLGLRRFS